MATGNQRGRWICSELLFDEVNSDELMHFIIVTDAAAQLTQEITAAGVIASILGTIPQLHIIGGTLGSNVCLNVNGYVIYRYGCCDSSGKEH